MCVRGDTLILTMRKPDRDALHRLRQAEAELESTTLESHELRQRVGQALRPDQNLPWPSGSSVDPDSASGNA